jgi:hypothetical protein
MTKTLNFQKLIVDSVVCDSTFMSPKFSIAHKMYDDDDDDDDDGNENDKMR